MMAKQKAKSGPGHVHGPDCGHNHQHGPAPSPGATLAPATPLLINEALFTPMPGVDNNDRSKDELFVRLAFVADAMIKAHGKDFTMGSLVLAARFIAEGKPLIKRKQETEAAGS
jgi:hypothetical protein